MDDAALVRGGEAGADLPRDLEPAVFGESADASQQRGQVFAVHVLHREERVPFDLVDVVDAADVWMRHLARHPHFGVQLRQPRGILIDFRRQELERDRLPELEVVGAEDLAHAAAAEASDDAVAGAEDVAGRKASVVDGAGGREPSAGRGAALGVLWSAMLAGAVEASRFVLRLVPARRVRSSSPGGSESMGFVKEALNAGGQLVRVILAELSAILPQRSRCRLDRRDPEPLAVPAA